MKRKHYLISSLACILLLALFFAFFFMKFKDGNDAWFYFRTGGAVRVFLILSIVLIAILIFILAIQPSITQDTPYFSILSPVLSFLLLVMQLVMIYLDFKSGSTEVGLILTTIASALVFIANVVFMIPIVKHVVNNSVKLDEKL